MLKNYAHWITYHPRWVMLISLLVLIGASIGIGSLSFKSDLRIYFNEDNPQVIALDNMEQTYTKADNVLFVLAPKEGVFNNEVLAVIEDLTAKAWMIPFSSRVDSITNFKYSAAEGDDILVDDLVIDAKQLSAVEIENSPLLTSPKNGGIRNHFNPNLPIRRFRAKS